MHDFLSFYHRLKKNLYSIGRWARRHDIEAYRLYDRDIPQFPFSIDRYGDKLHLQEYDTGWQISEGDYQAWLKEIISILSKVTSISHQDIFLKKRERKRGKTQYEKYEKQAHGRHRFIVHENQHAFWVDLLSYLDSGLFLDHRPMRGYVQKQAQNKRFLNLFCYTASFSVYAAKGKAAYSESVDLSNVYLAWAKENFVLNQVNLSKHRLIRADVFQYLQEAHKQGKKFDLIVLDPPSFSNSKRMRNVLDIQKNQIELVSCCMRLLSSSGLLIFSTNLRSFRLATELNTCYQISDQTASSIPRDFRDRKIHRCWHIAH